MRRGLLPLQPSTACAQRAHGRALPLQLLALFADTPQAFSPFSGACAASARPGRGPAPVTLGSCRPRSRVPLVHNILAFTSIHGTHRCGDYHGPTSVSRALESVGCSQPGAGLFATVRPSLSAPLPFSSSKTPRQHQRRAGAARVRPAAAAAGVSAGVQTERTAWRPCPVFSSECPASCRTLAPVGVHGL